MLFIFIYLTVIKYIASSPYGNFSKTTFEIEALIKSQKKVDFDYLSYPEQLIEIEKRKAQGVRDRKKKSAENKAKAKRVRHKYLQAHNTTSSFNAWDDLTLAHSASNLFNDDDDYFIDTTIGDSDSLEMPKTNPTTGFVMLSNTSSAGLDAGGCFFGEIPSLDDSINGSFSSIDDSFSSFDDAFSDSSSYDDLSDITSCGMDEW